MHVHQYIDYIENFEVFAQSNFVPELFFLYWSFKKHVTALTYKCQTVLFALLLNRVDFILKYFDFMFVIKKNVTVKVVFIYFF